jgi:DNA-binding transcriptional MerR regulator
MTINELPMLVRAGEASKFTGLTREQLAELADRGVLKMHRLDKGWRFYSRESLKKLVKAEGTENI